jgi:sulfate transport system substrate-binding protein
MELKRLSLLAFPALPAFAARRGTFEHILEHIRLLRVDKTLGRWGEAQETHFADGGTFDQIHTR